MTAPVTIAGVVNERRGPYRVQQFDSLAALVEFCATPVEALGFSAHNARQSNSVAKTGAWYFGTFGDVAGYEKARHDGWPSAVKRIDALSASLAGNVAAPLDLRRRPKRGAQGDEFCIHSARAGKLDRAWSRRDREFTKTRAPLRILVDCTANSDIGEAQFFWRGAAAIALAKPLIARGYRVAITALIGTAGTYETRGVNYMASINVKGYGESLDVARLASVLCTPATLRHLGFKAILRAEETGCTGYGHAMYNDAIMEHGVKANLFGHRAEERLLVPGLWTEDRAQQWLAKVSQDFAA